MNKYVMFLLALKDMDSRFRGNDSRVKAGMTAESRFSLSVIPVKTGIQDVVGAAHYSIFQLAHYGDFTNPSHRKRHLLISSSMPPSGANPVFLIFSIL